MAINGEDSEESLQGRIDILVLGDRLWVTVLKSKQTMLSVWSALPQTLAYLMALFFNKLNKSVNWLYRNNLISIKPILKLKY